MKSILGIIGSPRKLGNCEVLVKEIGARVPAPHQLKLLRLSDFRLESCTGCYRCLYEGKCALDDDLPIIMEAMAEADAYIVAAPAYFLGANAALKRLQDRGLSFYGIKETLWGKPSLAVAVAGIAGKEGSTLLAIGSFLKCALSDIKASAVVYAALPGEVFFAEGNLRVARELGAALFGEAIPGDGPRCPLCGGDSFRFLGTDRVRCMLCGHDGALSVREGDARLRYPPGRARSLPGPGCGRAARGMAAGDEGPARGRAAQDTRGTRALPGRRLDQALGRHRRPA